MGNGDGPITQVDQAINVGFSHVGELDAAFRSEKGIAQPKFLDTAQAYGNEEEAGA